MITNESEPPLLGNFASRLFRKKRVLSCPVFFRQTPKYQQQQNIMAVTRKITSRSLPHPPLTCQENNVKARHSVDPLQSPDASGVRLLESAGNLYTHTHTHTHGTPCLLKWPSEVIWYLSFSFFSSFFYLFVYPRSLTSANNAPGCRVTSMKSFLPVYIGKKKKKWEE